MTMPPRTGLKVALMALLAFAEPAPALADTVPVRAWNQDGFGRLVFDWPVPVAFDARISNGKLVVTFDQPIQTSLESVVLSLPDYLKAGRIDADGRTIVFDLTRPVALRNFRNGNSVALDLVNSAGGPETQASMVRPTVAEGLPPAPASPVAAAASVPAKSEKPGVPVVKVRPGLHPDRNRLVFDWPQPVDYSVEQQGQTVQIAFAKPGQADFSAVQRTRLRNVPTIGQTIADGRLVVQVTIPEGSPIRHFRTGSSVALDVIDPPRPNQPAKAETQPQARAPAPLVTDQKRSVGAPPATPAPAPSTQASPPTTTPAVAPPAASPTPVPAAATPPAPLRGAAPPAPAAAPRTPVTMDPAAVVAEIQRSLIVVDAGQPAAAAVWVRAGHLNVLFDRPLNLEGRIRIEGATSTLGPVEPLPVRGAGGFRIAVPSGMHPTVTREGNVWRIALGALPAEPLISLPVEGQRDFPFGARLVVGVAEPGQAITVPDPTVGDALLVVPLTAGGQGVTVPHGYVQLRILPAAQGIVVQPIDDTVAVRPLREGVEMTAGSGLVLAPSADLIGTDLASSRLGKGAGLFEIARWRRGGIEDFTRNRQALQQTVVEAADPDRDRARLDLARFYFAHGYGPETLGLLRIIAANQPDMESRPEFLALRGVSHLLTGDAEAAAADLANPGLDGNAEAALWRAAAAASRRDWPAAIRDFSRTRDVLDGYPDPFYRRLALLAAEAAIQGGNGIDAARVLGRATARSTELTDAHPAVRFLRGHINRLAGRLEEAAEQWRQAAASSDWLYRARSELALTELEMEQGQLSPAQAIDRLERLRFAWRGDDYELDVLERLARTYIGAGNHAAGFNTLRQAMSYFPDSPRAARYPALMQGWFADLYRKDGAASLPPVEALGLYEQFRDLTPTGPVGDEITRKLAERLVEIDLLGRAGDLLQQQVDARLQGREKAAVGMRLAEIRLQDGKADAALDALDRTEDGDITPDLAAERRILKARALADLKRYGDAVAVLKEDSSPSADLMRVDIAWRGGKWAEAAAGLDKIIGPAPPSGTPLSRDKTDLVLNRAVALALAGDANGLNKLRNDFAGAMAETAHADTFRILTRPGESGNLIDLGAIQSRVGEVGVFQRFLDGYRKKAGA